jgi:hypothetical protein
VNATPPKTEGGIRNAFEGARFVDTQFSYLRVPVADSDAADIGAHFEYGVQRHVM